MKFTSATSTLALATTLSLTTATPSHHLPSLSLSAPRSPLDDTCTPSRQTCTFYTDCLESRYHCGPTGYPLGYGGRFCQGFADQSDIFSPRGKQWIDNVRFCLQSSLVPFVNGPNGVGDGDGEGEDGGEDGEGYTCADVREAAYDSHSGCYVDNGVCLLPPSDWIAIQRVVGFENLFGTPEALEEVIKAAGGCARLYAYLLKEVLGGGLPQ